MSSQLDRVIIGGSEAGLALGVPPAAGRAAVRDRRGRRPGRRSTITAITHVPGLAFLGLPWQRSRGSALVGWVGRDAELLADHLAAQLHCTPRRVGVAA